MVLVLIQLNQYKLQSRRQLLMVWRNSFKSYTLNHRLKVCRFSQFQNFQTITTLDFVHNPYHPEERLANHGLTILHTHAFQPMAKYICENLFCVICLSWHVAQQWFRQHRTRTPKLQKANWKLQQLSMNCLYLDSSACSSVQPIFSFASHSRRNHTGYRTCIIVRVPDASHRLLSLWPIKATSTSISEVALMRRSLPCSTGVCSCAFRSLLQDVWHFPKAIDRFIAQRSPSVIRKPPVERPRTSVPSTERPCQLWRWRGPWSWRETGLGLFCANCMNRFDPAKPIPAAVEETIADGLKWQFHKLHTQTSSKGLQFLAIWHFQNNHLQFDTFSQETMLEGHHTACSQNSTLHADTL